MTKNSSTIDSSALARRKHWDGLFERVDYTQVLWHQHSPKDSLEAIKDYSISKNDAILDVGCGASLLVDRLLDEGYADITLLDTSKTSLEIVQERLATYEISPQYCIGDILLFQAEKQYDLWHDRAVFHFLLTKAERAQYFNVLEKSLKVDGIAILSTFAPYGQTACAGLNTRAYDKEQMLREIPEGLALVSYKAFTHMTPKQTEQAYSMFILQKKEC